MNETYNTFRSSKQITYVFVRASTTGVLTTMLFAASVVWEDVSCENAINNNIWIKKNRLIFIRVYFLSKIE